jgi:DNA-directed RNA polymerase subunit L
MEIEILKDEKNELDVKVNDLTVVELLRHYLNKNGADLAVWRKEHLDEAPVLHIEAPNPKKLLKDTIKNLQKEISAIESDFNKSVK